MKVSIALSVLASALMLSSCDEPNPIPQSSGAVVQNALLDTSVIGTTVGGAAYCAYHSNGARVSGSNGENRFSGTWEIKQDNICYGLTNRRTECQYAKVEVETNEIRFYNRLDARLIAGGRMVEGNQCGG